MNILEKLGVPEHNAAEHIRNMNIAELDDLCGELRSFLLSNISKTGGHLASNLGVVEITVAIHNVFDTAKDRLIFDVGHQCYTHKILSGRKDGFEHLRGIDGVSGFPNPTESEHDAYISGHASTSVSVALGMARARTAMEQNYTVLALIGDGALTGGLVYEGLSDAGQSGEPLIVILNDNEMSITENVGGLARHLARLRVRNYYLSFKKFYRKAIVKIPFLGKRIDRMLRKIKSGIKEALLPSSMFENMGFVYIGPADGHNIKEICRLLKVARDIKKPVLIHLKTTKGKGYKYAEEKPESYHGVSEFDIESGESAFSGTDTFASAFGEALADNALKDERICAITAAMKTGTGLEKFAEHFEDRFFDVGIAEGHAVTMAGGLSKQGMLPVCAIYSTFIQRAYDMIFHDICLPNQHVIFAVDRAGLVAEDGQTHQGIFDVGMFLQMPNMTILCPSAMSEVKQLLRYAVYDIKGPVVIRYPRGANDRFAHETIPNKPISLKEGTDIAIVTYGRMCENAMDAAELLAKKGISASVVKATEISSLTITELSNLLGDIKNIIVVEECVSGGCLASKLALEASDVNSNIRIIPINLGSATVPHASIEELMEMFSLDAKGIANKALEIFGKN